MNYSDPSKTFQMLQNPFDPEKFSKGLSLFSDTEIQNLVSEARRQGISESNIQEGLSLIAKIKNQGK